MKILLLMDAICLAAVICVDQFPAFFMETIGGAILYALILISSIFFLGLSFICSLD